jgi:hypothetical protein
MILGAAPTGAIVITLPWRFWIARAIAVTTAVGLQLVGLYAAVVTFGGRAAVGLYSVGGLALLLQHVVFWRSPTCSLGD